MKKAIVALARRLAVIMHRMWVDGSAPRRRESLVEEESTQRMSIDLIADERFGSGDRKGWSLVRKVALGGDDG